MARDWLSFMYTPTLLAEGCRVRGDLQLVSYSLIQGLVEGSVTHSSVETLQVGRTGWIFGTIEAKGPVVVEGRVDGNIVSDTYIRLTPTASVSGSLKAPAVDVQSGALLQGEVQMPVPRVRSLTPRKAAG